MKMTTDMHFALQDALTGCGDGVQCREAIFLAGYRLGQRDMRERAAKVAIDRFDPACKCRGCNESAYIATRIRGLSVEES